MQMIKLATVPQGYGRKELAQKLAKVLEQESRYLGTPSFAYEIGGVKIEKNCEITIREDMPLEEAKRVLEALRGMDIAIEKQPEAEETDTPVDEMQYQLKVELPESIFDDKAMNNLLNLIQAKGRLIQKALGIDDLPIYRREGKLEFAWFNGEPDPDHIQAYTSFVCALGKMAREQQHVSSKEKEIQNEKYAFRCFLLRLGFIGREHKATRKILMEKLQGCSAFKNGKKKEAENHETA